jgi:hypothetical protein
MNPYIEKVYALTLKTAVEPFDRWVMCDHPSEVIESLEWVDDVDYPLGIVLDFYKNCVDITINEKKKYTHYVYTDQDVEMVLEHVMECMEEME